MEFFAIILIFLLFTSNFFRNKRTFLFTYITLVLFYDYIFINITLKYPNQNWVYFIKAWQEYLFIFLIIRYLIIVKPTIDNINKQLKIPFFILTLISIYSILVSIMLKIEPMKVLLGYRSYLFPLFIPYLCYLNKLFVGVKPKFLLKYILIYIFACLCLAYYQRILFHECGGNEFIVDFSNKESYLVMDKIFDHTFWYSNFFDMSIMGNWYDRVRDFNVRATSFYVSPLIYSLLMNLCLTLLSIYIIYSKRIIYRFFFIVGIFICLLGIHYSQVRSSYIFLFISLFSIFLLKYKNKSYRYIFFFPIILVLLTFLKLEFLGGEGSSIARLIQIKYFITEFSIIGKGLGSIEADVKYDSMFISSLFAFGALGLYFFHFHFKLVQIVFNNIKEMDSQFIFYPIGIFIISSFMGLIYFSFFQYTIGSPTLKIFYFFIFYFLSNVERK